MKKTVNKLFVPKNSWWLLGGTVVSGILHNLFYGLTKIEEPVFFTLTLIFGLLFVLVSVVVMLKLITAKVKQN